jgi:hypothetical protein
MKRAYEDNKVQLIVEYREFHYFLVLFGITSFVQIHHNAIQEL